MSSVKWEYILKDIKVVSDRDLIQLTKLMNKDCQPGKYSLMEVRDKFAKTMDILYTARNKSQDHGLDFCY